jgi:hypothetical protein
MRKLLVLLLFAASPAWAQETKAVAFVSGNMLHDWFQARETEIEARSYVLGAHDALKFVQGLKLVQGTQQLCLFDIPTGVTGGQVQDVVKLYLEKHPEGRNYAATSDVLAALREAWPCKKSPRK